MKESATVTEAMASPEKKQMDECDGEGDGFNM